MSIKTIAALLTVTLLQACGGGGSNPAQPTQPPAACTALPQVRIQLYGDSTQMGWDWSDPNNGVIAANNPASALQAFFDAKYGAGKVTVSSRATGGTTAKELVAGTDGLNAPWPQSVQAEIAIINYAITDRTHDDDLPAYRAALEALAIAPAQVVFETPNQVHAYDLTAYAQTMRDVAAEHGLPVADVFAFTLEPAEFALMSDWAHPTNALYGDISKHVVQPTVGPLVAKLLCQ